MLIDYTTQELKEKIEELTEKKNRPSMMPWQVTCYEADIDSCRDELERRKRKAGK